MNTCPDCGGAMVGDGYTRPIHCETLDLTGEAFEPDCNPVTCGDYEAQANGKVTD